MADQATETMIANLAKQTGKTLEQWASLAKMSGHAKHGQVVAWLKSDHGLTHGYANLVAHTAFKSDAASQAAEVGGDALVDAQYAGAKAPLRPLYDALAEAIAKFGADVEFAPKKAYVSLRRSKQFGLIQPSTATRLDVGICLKTLKAAGRLEVSGSWNAMASHRVRVERPSDIDAQLIGWLRQAYAAA